MKNKYNLSKIAISNKAFFLVLFSLFISNNINAQNKQSIQFDGGVISPRTSSDGYSLRLQYNYEINQTFKFYAYSGYSSWDKFHDVYIDFIRINDKDHERKFRTYSEDNHKLIPIFVGIRSNIKTNKLFAAFLDFEFGYSLLKFNSFENYKVIDPNTNNVISYNADKTSKKSETKNNWGIGIACGLSHSITNRLNVLLTYKINSSFNYGEFGLLSQKGTYSSLLAGLELNL